MSPAFVTLYAHGGLATDGADLGLGATGFANRVGRFALRVEGSIGTSGGEPRTTVLGGLLLDAHTPSGPCFEGGVGERDGVPFVVFGGGYRWWDARLRVAPLRGIALRLISPPGEVSIGVTVDLGVALREGS